MLSSDKNVASIAELVEALKQYVGLQKEYLELNVIEKIVKLACSTHGAWPGLLLGSIGFPLLARSCLRLPQAVD